MSVKHLAQYYNEVTNQYQEMLDELRDMESYFSEGMVSPEMLENMKKLIQPIKENYERISWIMYLLNKPSDKKTKKKKDKYNKEATKKYKLKENANPKTIVENNKEYFNKMKETYNSGTTST